MSQLPTGSRDPGHPLRWVAELEAERDNALAAIEVMQTAHEQQLTRQAKALAKAHRKIERMTAALEAAQRPPLGYAVGPRTSAPFPPNIEDVHPTREGAEAEAKTLQEAQEWTEYRVYEVREVRP
ncbi:hypothetical protein AB0H76_15180 [Nocardia sp. NPDC050712]|uniref:hypothetical protein n=1 Tax=Nocardia sp. NPDC050712 TaxID=3155518 RepID=UPI0033FF4966